MHAAAAERPPFRSTGSRAKRAGVGRRFGENLLRLGRGKAAQLGLSHAEFRLGDIEALDPVARR